MALEVVATKIATHPKQTCELPLLLGLVPNLLSECHTRIPQQNAKLRVDNLHYDLTEDDLDVQVPSPSSTPITTNALPRTSSPASPLSPPSPSASTAPAAPPAQPSYPTPPSPPPEPLSENSTARMLMGSLSASPCFPRRMRTVPQQRATRSTMPSNLRAVCSTGLRSQGAVGIEAVIAVEALARQGEVTSGNLHPKAWIVTCLGAKEEG